MRKLCTYILLVIAILVFSGCYATKATIEYNPHFAPPDVIETVREHTLSIAVYYYVNKEEYLRRKKALQQQGRWREHILDSQARDVFLNIPLIYKPNIVFPMGIQQQGGNNPTYAIAYVGSGTLVRMNCVISVRHLFVHNNNTLGKKIFVFKEGLDHPVEANIVAISDGKEHYDDYAVIHLKESLGLPGLKIAKPGSLKLGDKVIYSGTPGGARMTRYGYVTEFKWFFQRGNDENLHFSRWDNFHYWMVPIGAPGDSGGSIITIDGKLATVLYCGIAIYGTHYIFANPTSMLHDFLARHNLSWLIE